MSFDDLQEDLQAELGYRTAGRRELSQREWYSLRGEADEVAPTPKAFDKLVNVLRVTKWAKANPEKRKAIANRYYARHGVPERQLKAQREARHAAARAAGEVFTCAECGAQWRRVPGTYRGGPVRRFCTDTCCARNLQQHQRRRAGIRQTSCSVCGKSGHNARRHQ